MGCEHVRFGCEAGAPRSAAVGSPPQLSVGLRGLHCCGEKRSNGNDPVGASARLPVGRKGLLRGRSRRPPRRSTVTTGGIPLRPQHVLISCRRGALRQWDMYVRMPRKGDTVMSCAGRGPTGATGTRKRASRPREKDTWAFSCGHGRRAVPEIVTPAHWPGGGGTWTCFGGPGRTAVTGTGPLAAMPRGKVISIACGSLGQTDAPGPVLPAETPLEEAV